MRTLTFRLAAAAALVFMANAAAAQDKIRIGLIYTLSGPASALGQQSKNGFELALKDLGGKMGGKDVELVIADDELKPVQLKIVVFPAPLGPIRAKMELFLT